jgi:putative acetyltransferase
MTCEDGMRKADSATFAELPGVESALMPFGLPHYEEVYRLWSQCGGVGLSSADSREAIGRYLDRNPGLSFVALREGEICGAVLAGHDGRRGYIHHLAVAPGCRRLGLGRRLVKASLDALAAEGIEKAHLFVFKENADGLAFWRAGGWEVREDLAMMSRSTATGCASERDSSDPPRRRAPTDA